MKISGFVDPDALKYVKAQNKVQIGGPLCERTERDRDMKISGYVNLD